MTARNNNAEKFYVEKLRDLEPHRKLEIVKQLNNSCRKMALVGLRDRYPDADEEELRLRLASLWLERDTMIKVCSWDPAEKGL